MNTIHHVAHGLASLGRGNDKLLVHMTPNEVHGLQKLALASGGSLTINPHTGLPEAGWLSQLLPAFIGGGLSLMTGGMAAPIAGGALAGYLTRSKGEPGLMAAALGGLAGGAGSGLAQGMAGLGAGAGAGTAGTEAISAVPPLPSVVGAAGSTGAVPGVAGAAGAGAGSGLTGTFAENAANVGKGFGQLGSATTPQLAAHGITGMRLAAAASPMLGSAMYPENYTPTSAADSVNYWNTKYNPNTGQYEGGAFSPTFAAASGGSVPSAEDNFKALLNTPNSPAMKPPDPAILNAYLTQFNQQAAMPAYLRNPTSIYNPHRVPYLTPVNVPGQPAAAKQAGPAGTSDMPSYHYDPVTGTFVNTTIGGGGSGGGKRYAIGGGVMGGQPPPNIGQMGGMMGGAGQAGPMQPGAAGQPLPAGFNTMQARMQPGAAGVNPGGLSGMTGPMQPGAAGQPPPNLGQMGGMMGGAGNAPPPALPPGQAGPAGGLGAMAGMMGGQRGMNPQFANFIAQRQAQQGGLGGLGGMRPPGMMAGRPMMGGYGGGMRGMAGGGLLHGPGDGMSDSIPATINNKKPAALGDGEFVVDAHTVALLGNGSNSAGAKRLYAMMARVRKATTGRKSQPKQINADKYLPA